MSDSFADLWASSVPTKSISQQPQDKVSSTNPSRRQQYDAFSIPSASQPSRPVANHLSSDRQGRQPQPASYRRDAFGDLFPFSLADGTAAGRNPDRVRMTMAERAILAQKARAGQNHAASTQIEPPYTYSLWGGLDALARPVTSSPHPPASIQGNMATEDGFDFGLDSVHVANAVPSTRYLQNNATIENDDWGLSGFNDNFDCHSPSPNPSTSTRGPVRPPRTSPSPPPHITGQLVEMGFSPIDARAALANTVTENGFDVQAATELLLSQAGQEESARPSPPPPERERHRNGNRDRDRNRAACLPPPTHADFHAQSSSPSQTQPQPDVTAEKILSQASEIGRGMFSKANALWKEGKERAVKMYEERTVVSNAAGSTPASDSRPRWMRDGEWQRPNQTVGRSAVQVEFEDDEDGGQEIVRRERQRPPVHCPPQSQLQSQSQPPAQPEREWEVDLLSADSPTTAYQSPFRRGKPKAQTPPPSIHSPPSEPTLSTQIPTSRSSGPSTSQRSPQPPRTFTTTIALSALTASTSHKSAGTEAYKRGDFPVSLVVYTRALSALPPEHILRVPILTNMALVRSKVGELRETIKSCEEAVMIVRRFVSGADGEVGVGECCAPGRRGQADRWGYSR